MLTARRYGARAGSPARPPKSIALPAHWLDPALTITKPNSCLFRLESVLPRGGNGCYGFIMTSRRRAAFSHDGEMCSFGTILKVYGMRIAGLDRLALIVRGADTAPSRNLRAIARTHPRPFVGLSAKFRTDHARCSSTDGVYDAFTHGCAP